MTNIKRNANSNNQNNNTQHFMINNVISNPNNITKDKLDISRSSNTKIHNLKRKNSYNKLDISRQSTMGNNGKLFVSVNVKEEPVKPNLISITTNQHCTYFITSHGVFSIGNKESGLLGFVNTALLLNYPIPIDLSPQYKVVGVSASIQHVLVWDTDGRLFSWGSNNYGKLGIKDMQHQTGSFILKPMLVDLLGKKKVYSGLAGINSSFVITNKGEVYYWGKPFISLEGRGSIWELPTKLDCPKLPEEKIYYVKLANFEADNCPILRINCFPIMFVG